MLNTCGKRMHIALKGWRGLFNHVAPHGARLFRRPSTHPATNLVARHRVEL